MLTKNKEELFVVVLLPLAVPPEPSFLRDWRSTTQHNKKKEVK